MICLPPCSSDSAEARVDAVDRSRLDLVLADYLYLDIVDPPQKSRHWSQHAHNLREHRAWPAAPVRLYTSQPQRPLLLGAQSRCRSSEARGDRGRGGGGHPLPRQLPAAALQWGGIRAVCGPGPCTVLATDPEGPSAAAPRPRRRGWRGPRRPASRLLPNLSPRRSCRSLRPSRQGEGRRVPPPPQGTGWRWRGRCWRWRRPSASRPPTPPSGRRRPAPTHGNKKEAAAQQRVSSSSSSSSALIIPSRLPWWRGAQPPVPPKKPWALATPSLRLRLEMRSIACSRID